MTISAIVPCFNEEKWISRVIESLLVCPLISEIIVVNDGSTDNTLGVISRFKNKIKIITYKRNRGKGYAMATGIHMAKGKIVVFMDGHHLNIKNSHIESMTKPLINNQADVVLGTTKLSIPDPCQRFTGFRSYRRKELVPHLLTLEKTKFGAEIYLNDVFKEKTIKLIYPKGLVHLTKNQKMPLNKIPAVTLNQIIEMTKTLALTKGVSPAKIRKALLPQKINSIKSLKKAVLKLKNKEIVKILKSFILSYFKD